MRLHSLLIALLLLSASPALAQNQRWVLISGTVGVFHTDARVFNPSFDKDIQVTARFFPAGNPPVDNAGAAGGAGTTFTVPKRSMHILNDVTTALFNTSSLGAILFSSPDSFEVTSRIYAQLADGTLGQFGPGLPLSAAKSKGAILQMKLNGVGGQIGTFRTNIGVLNPGSGAATVNWRLYDRNNALVGTGDTTIPPFGVTTPILMNGTFFWDNLQAGVDLSDSWVSYSSDAPVFAYASVLDNGTTDQTFVPAVDDVGVIPQSPDPEPTTHSFEVELEDFSITILPAPQNIKVGDTVRMRIRRVNGTHGFSVSSPSFTTVVPDTRPNSPTDRSFTVTEPGTYTYFCTVTTCGVGHNNMFGTFTVGNGDDGPGPGPGY